MPTSLQLAGQPPQFLTAPTYILGRGSDCDVLLPEGDGLVSRHHTRLERDGQGQWWLTDTSTNGTFVNGEKIGAKKRLSDGDQIGIGKTQMSFASPESVSSPARPTPSRATETVFVAQNELDARLKDREMGVSTPTAPPIPPAFLEPKPSQPVAVPEVAVPEVAPFKSETPPVESIAFKPAPAPVAAVRPPTAPTPAERTPFDEVSSESPQTPPASAAPMTVDIPAAPMPLALSKAPSPQPIPTSATDSAKQCTRCRTLYAATAEECPACGHAGFKMRSGAPDPASVSTPSPTPASQPIAQSPAPAPVPVAPVLAPPVQQPPVQPSSNVAPNPPVNPQPGVSHVVHHVSLPTNYKSPGLALLISVFVWGGGQIYNGQIAKGVLMLCGGVFMGLLALIPFLGWIFWLPLFALGIYNLIDAYSTADRLSREAAAQQLKP